MRRPLPTRVLGPNGKPAAYYFFEGGSRRWQDTIPLWYWSGAADTKDVLSHYNWRQLMICGRFLYANVPMIRGALHEQANYAFPLERHYMGIDTKWGETGAAWLGELDKQCTFRGYPFNAEAVSRLRLLGSVVDGDIFTIMARDPDSGLPKLQLVRAHRVGDRFTTNGAPLKSGPFRGASINNGIVTDQYGRNVGFQILGDKPEADQFISTNGSNPDLPEGVILYRPMYADQVRGITEFVASINSLDDLKRLNEYEMRAQELFSSQGILEKNETGMADDTLDAIMRPEPTPGPDQKPTATGLITETFEGGMYRYFRSGSGSGLEAFRADRPTADASAFESRIVARAFYGIEWDPNFALMLKEPGGAWARITLAKINRRLSRVQAVEAQVKYRTDIAALSVAIYDLGVLPEPKDGDIFSWGYRGPARVTADSGNEATAKRNDYVLGLRTMEMHCIEEGGDWRLRRRQRRIEVINLFEEARQVIKAIPELKGDIQTAAKWIEDRNANIPLVAVPEDGELIDTETGPSEPQNQPSPDSDQLEE